MSDFEKAKSLLSEFKGDVYVYGAAVLPQVGGVVTSLGRRPVIVRSTFPGTDDYVHVIRRSLSEADVDAVRVIKGPRPNAPREDLVRITSELASANPDVIVSFGGGSTTDATKAAEVLRVLGGDITRYFGTDQVTRAVEEDGAALAPHVAIQTAASSAAHLTRYSNITDLSTGQKKLIVDDAIVPAYPFFEHTVTYDAPSELTADGGLDGISHALEVLYGAVDKPFYGKAEEIAETAIRLIVTYLADAMRYPKDVRAREALCLGTDLGGYAIVIGGTNGGHLTSFSLVDVLSHGRACAIMNPYYTVLFAPAIERPLRVVGEIFKEAGYTQAAIDHLTGCDLGVAVAEAMLELNQRIGVPTSLGEVGQVTEQHIERALRAAKDPQLEMKLRNMPIPLTPDTLDASMGSVLRAAWEGDPGLVKNAPI